MRRTPATVVSTIWFALAPGLVSGVVPWLLTGWRLGRPIEDLFPLRLAGAALVVVSGAVLVHAFTKFVVEGLGTPAPPAPPERLVVGGLYRYVRNPMYVASVAAIVGQLLVLWRLDLIWYAVAVTVAVVLFVHLYEEPRLRAQFGAQYAEYQRRVGRWFPRLR
ncbi:MAG: methyltransferase family protein [Nocardioidaceae bacterium]